MPILLPSFSTFSFHLPPLLHLPILPPSLSPLCLLLLVPFSMDLFLFCLKFWCFVWDHGCEVKAPIGSSCEAFTSKSSPPPLLGNDNDDDDDNDNDDDDSNTSESIV